MAADVPPARRSAPGGRDDRRDRDQGPDEHRRVGDHDRGRQARARSVGRDAPRTRPSPARCCPTSSPAGWMSSRECCSRSTAPKRSECSRELRVRASDRPDPRAAEKESAVMCSTQRTDGTPSRLRGRVCGCGSIAPRCCCATLSPADAVRALQAEFGLSERQARRYVNAGLGRPDGVPVPERTAVFTVRLAPSLIDGLREPGGSDRSDVERGDGRGGAWLSRWCWRAGRWPGVLRSSSSVTGSPARGWHRRTRCWRPSGGV